MLREFQKWLGAVEVPRCLEAPTRRVAAIPVRVRWRLLAVSSVTAVAVGTTAVSCGWAGSASATTITVQRGQTLTAIAAQLHTTVSALAGANGITNPNLVYAGAVLRVPSSGSGSSSGLSAGAGSSSANSFAVVLAPGDTLSSIARRYGTSVAALVAANGITNSNYVQAGKRIVIPGAGQTSTGAGGGAAAAAAAAASGSMTLASYSVPAALAAFPGRMALQPYFVQAASAYGVSVSVLEALCWWESGWQASIVSPTGAIGVCQVEPSTAAFINAWLVSSPLDPHVAGQNIALGAAYLASLIRATGGNVSQAIAGYYQGLTSVRTQGMFPSTATYVHGILAYASMFSG